MRLTFSGEVIHWRGPAPHHFVALPEEDSEELAAHPELSYGWGCIPVQVTVGGTAFETSLMPHEGRYLLPLKVAVRQSEAIDLGDVVTICLEVAE